MTAFRPGASPPPVQIAIFFIASVILLLAFANCASQPRLPLCPTPSSGAVQALSLRKLRRISGDLAGLILSEQPVRRPRPVITSCPVGMETSAGLCSIYEQLSRVLRNSA